MFEDLKKLAQVKVRQTKPKKETEADIKRRKKEAEKAIKELKKYFNR